MVTFRYKSIGWRHLYTKGCNKVSFDLPYLYKFSPFKNRRELIIDLELDRLSGYDWVVADPVKAATTRF